MEIVLLIAIICFILVLFSVLLEIYIFKNAPFLESTKNEKAINTSLTIIIPTYNEENNIVNCLSSISKIKRPSTKFKIIVVDDCSNDKTIEKATNCKIKLFKNSETLEIISAGNRPKDRNWVGKNWACWVGSLRTKSDWLLFIDADVVVGEKCVLNAISKALKDNIDLLSLAPKVNCNCLAEWMVQPIMTSLLMIGFPITNVNSKGNNTSFAAGPFMLFKRNSYLKIGGHEGTYDQIVEDLALAKRIKASELKLNFLIAINDISLNMYKDINSLIEGWSKNWFIGLEKSIFKSLSGSIFVLFTNTMPWFLLISTVIIAIKYQTLRYIYLTIFSLLTLSIYAFKRYWLQNKYSLPMKYWYLNGLGGIVVFYIGLISIYKTITGIGWTWKGRQLY